MLCGEKILTLRKKYGYTQEALAAKLLVSHQAVSRWESGQTLPDVEKLVQLSHLFGVSTDYLLDDRQPIGGEQKTEAQNKGNRRGGKLSMVLLSVGIVLLLLTILYYLIPSTVMVEQLVTDSAQTQTETVLENSQASAEGSEAMRYVYTSTQMYGLFPFLSCYHLWPVFLLCCAAIGGGVLGRRRSAI